MYQSNLVQNVSLFNYITDSANLRKVFNYIDILHKLEILNSELTAKPLILGMRGEANSGLALQN